LAAVGSDDVCDPEEGYRNDTQAKTEEQNKLGLALHAHGAVDDDRHGKQYQQQIRENVAHPGGEQVYISLAAVAPWVGQYLPVVVEGSAFGQVANDDGDKSEPEHATDGADAIRIGAGPGETSKTLKKF
jgi:hypothetical protein